MQKTTTHLLIFTDLDGTLLDHNDYSADPADRLIARLSKSEQFNIIPVTSKTRSELLHLQAAIPLPHSIGITENGSVIHINDARFFAEDTPSKVITMGMEYQEVLKHVAGIPSTLRNCLRGFADMSVKQVTKETGLSHDDAKRAKERDATEPFLWSGSDAEFSEMEGLFAQADIRVQRGGRFYHLTGQADKEQAMAKVTTAFAERNPKDRIVSVALGDGPNDLAMIEAADIGVIMPNPNGVTISSSKSHIRTAPIPGPKGWDIAIREIIAELGLILPQS